ncbi:MAG: hypothetical protein AAF662_01480 [Pseudomonadota bacterium]
MTRIALFLVTLLLLAHSSAADTRTAPDKPWWFKIERDQVYPDEELTPGYSPNVVCSLKYFVSKKEHEIDFVDIYVVFLWLQHDSKVGDKVLLAGAPVFVLSAVRENGHEGQEFVPVLPPLISVVVEGIPTEIYTLSSELHQSFHFFSGRDVEQVLENAIKSKETIQIQVTFEGQKSRTFDVPTRESQSFGMYAELLTQCGRMLSDKQLQRISIDSATAVLPQAAHRVDSAAEPRR